MGRKDNYNNTYFLWVKYGNKSKQDTFLSAVKSELNSPQRKFQYTTMRKYFIFCSTLVYTAFRKIWAFVVQIQRKHPK